MSMEDKDIKIKAPDRGAYENYERTVYIQDENKSINFSATKVETHIGGYGADYIDFKNGEWYKVRLLHKESGWYFEPMLGEEDADTFRVKTSKKVAKKLLKEFDAWDR